MNDEPYRAPESGVPESDPRSPARRDSPLWAWVLIWIVIQVMSVAFLSAWWSRGLIKFSAAAGINDSSANLAPVAVAERRPAVQHTHSVDTVLHRKHRGSGSA